MAAWFQRHVEGCAARRIAGDLSEPFQSVVTNGMIIYALTRDAEAKK